VSASKKPERKPYHHGDLRRALIEAAIEQLHTSAPTKVSLRGVAESVGVSHTAAYRHFRDKSELMGAVSETGFLQLRDRLAEAKRGHNLFRRQFERMSRAYIAFALEQRTTYRLMFGPRFIEQLTRAGVAESAHAAFAELLTAVMKAQSRGEVRGESPFLISQTAWALLHGLALFYLDGELGPEVDSAIATSASKFLWEGIQASDPP
jgi:AcrR family transcriptional regulator